MIEIKLTKTESEILLAVMQNAFDFISLTAKQRETLSKIYTKLKEKQHEKTN